MRLREAEGARITPGAYSIHNPNRSSSHNNNIETVTSNYTEDELTPAHVVEEAELVIKIVASDDDGDDTRDNPPVEVVDETNEMDTDDSDSIVLEGKPVSRCEIQRHRWYFALTIFVSVVVAVAIVLGRPRDQGDETDADPTLTHPEAPVATPLPTNMPTTNKPTTTRPTTNKPTTVPGTWILADRVSSLYQRREETESLTTTNSNSSQPANSSLSTPSPLYFRSTFREVLDDPASPQSKALNWLLTEDAAYINAEFGPGDEDFLLQRYAVATLFYSTGGENWANDLRFMTPGVRECAWSDSGIDPQYTIGISRCDAATGRIHEIRLCEIKVVCLHAVSCIPFHLT